MNTGGLILVIGTLAAATLAFIWLARKVGRTPASPLDSQASLDRTAKSEVEHIFDNEFREELRNRGRLHFEKVIGENAMFLQQDLRQTTAQLNDYMRGEIMRTLQEEFKKYEQSISDAKQIALQSIDKTIATIDQQRDFLESQLHTQSEAQKQQILTRFEKSMANILNHYIIQALGDQIDISDQLDFILAQLENNKADILEDIKRGA